MKIYFVLLFGLSTSLLSAQQYRIVTIPVSYNYEFNNGYADGSGTCTSCWEYTSRIPGIVRAESLDNIENNFLTDEEELSLFFYENRTRTVNEPFNQVNYCTSSRYNSRDEFTGRKTGYCEARVNIESGLLRPGEPIELGNRNSSNLSAPDHSSALSYMKVYMVPNVDTFSSTVGICQPLFDQPGANIPGGYWEYLRDEETEWKKMEGLYSRRYPLDVSLEELNANTVADLGSMRHLKLRFILTAEGGGSFHGFNTAGSNSSTEVKGNAGRVLGIYSFSIFRCAPDLHAPPVIENVKCFGGSTGNFMLSFSRNLSREEDEKMLIMLYQVLGTNFQFLESKTIDSADMPESFWQWPPELSPGVYKVRWMTKVGGNETESIPDAWKESEPFEIKEPGLLEMELEGTDILCKNARDGSIQINTLGGIPPYLYSLGDGQWQEEPYFTGLPSGAYRVHVRDMNNCLAVGEITISEPSSIPVVELLNASDPTANGAKDGFIGLLVSGGTPPYSYTWKNEENIISESRNLEDIGAGTYHFQATDDNGCTTEIYQYTLIQPDPLQVQITAGRDTLSCDGDRTVIRAQGIGSASEWDNSYSYRWGDGSTDPVKYNVGSGDYTVEVYDKYGNSASSEISIIAPPPLRVEKRVFHIPCKDFSNGQILLDIRGGTGLFQVQWSKLGDAQFSATGAQVENLPPGSYVYEVRDSNDCTLDNYDNPIEIREPLEELVVSDIIRGEISAYGGSDGVLGIEVKGGTPPYEYEWIGPHGMLAGTRVISGLEEGIYTVMVKDQNAGDEPRLGCYLIEEFELMAPEPLEVVIEEVLSVSCNEEQDAILRGIVNGGVPPYSFQWFRVDGDREVGLSSPAELLESVGAGMYFFRVTDNNDQNITSDTIEVRQPTVLQVTGSEITNASCSAMNDGGISIEVKGGVGPYNVEWSNGVSGLQNFDLLPRDYDVFIRDANGCEISASYTVISVNKLKIEILDMLEPEENGGNTGEIWLGFQGGEPPYSLYADDQLIFEGNNSEFHLQGLRAGKYAFTLRDAGNCESTFSVELNEPPLVVIQVTPPSCPGACDGGASVIINDRVIGEISYKWDFGSTAPIVTGLCSGVYELEVVGMSADPKKYTVEIPEPVLPGIELPEHIVLCTGSIETLVYEDQPDNARLEWWKGSELLSVSRELNVELPGHYELRVITGECIYVHKFDVEVVESDRSPEFIMPTQAYTNEYVFAVDVTTPVPEAVNWYLPEEAVVTEKSEDGISFYLKEPGEYEIGMGIDNGVCTSTIYKKLLVTDAGILAEGSGYQMRAKEPRIYPNPVGSYFYFDMELEITGPLSVKVYSLANNQLITHLKDSGKKAYHKKVDLSMSPPGLYALVLESNQGSRVYKLVKE